MARDGSTPAPDAVEAPAADLTPSLVAVLVDAGPVVVAVAGASSSDARPPGWPLDAPPNRVGTVVLVV
jgi:hypothetical protein